MLISECAETNGTGKLSPTGQYLALSKSLTVKLYHLSESLKFLTRWSVKDEVTSLQWSQDESLLMCVQKKRGRIDLFSTFDYSWSCLIDPGLQGISHSLISSDSRNILIIDSSKSTLEAWSLRFQTRKRLKPPKFDKKGLSFSNDCKFLAMVTRNEQDFLSIFNCEDWRCLFEHPVTFLVSDLLFVNDSAVLVWSESFDYEFSVVRTTGEVLFKYEGNNLVPGIHKIVSNSSYFAVCGLDFKIRVFHQGSWVLYHLFCYKKAVVFDKTIVLQECQEFKNDQVSGLQFEFIKSSMKSHSETNFCVWRRDGKILATVLKVLPHLVWIWDCRVSALAAVVFLLKSVKSITWAEEFLVWACGDRVVYMWNESQEVLTCSTGDISIQKVEYNSGSFLLQNKSLAVYAKLTH
jgi:hypothetical protein